LQTAAPEVAINQIGFLAAREDQTTDGGLQANVSKDIFQIMETLFTEDSRDRVSGIRIRGTL
jgi:hypothetical protein